MRAFGLVALLTVSMLVPVQAQPSLAEEVPCATNAVVGAVGEERFFCEPLQSTFFVQFEQFLAGLEELEELYPDYIEVRDIGLSVEGRPIKFVEVTNEQSATPRDEKIQIGYSASIHANEPAGREGMTRVVEDLAAGKGPYGAELRPILDNVILNVWFANPDSWYAGDYFSSDSTAQLHPPIGFARANAAGVDLNREFPSPGWIHPPHTPMSEPESRAVVNELRFSGNHSNLATGTDLHGMPTSPNAIRSIIPNQDYDFRRMVLIVDQLRTTQQRVESNMAFAEWEGAGTATAMAKEALAAAGEPVPEACVPAVLLAPCTDDPESLIGRAYEWGARWDMIGYTDSGFTSDYLMLSPRSPTGGMGAVGTIVEFSYSHIVPDNRYVAKFIDMHVQGVREIVRTQLEMAGRLETPVLADTGPIAYLDDGVRVTSENDPNPYVAPNGKDFDKDDPEARFEFNQVPYDVTNVNFWRDLGRFSEDPVDPLDAATFSKSDLAGYEHLAITDQVIEALFPDQIEDIRSWVDEGGHLFLTDRAIQFFDFAQITDGAATQQCAYLGHSNFVESHPLLAGVDWTIRVTGEATATGYRALGNDRNYPVWGLNGAAYTGVSGAQVVGTTSSSGQSSNYNGTVGPTCQTTQGGQIVSVGHVPYGSGSIDFIGGALPLPTQAYDHRYGLADYSVSAVTYWIIMNSMGGSVEWLPLESPFIPEYDYDPLYGKQGVYNPDREEPEPEGKPPVSTEDAPFVGVPLVLLAVALLAMRRRAN